MAASLVQTAINRNQGSASTITCTLPGTVTIGNRIVMVGYAVNETRTYVSTADTNGETWAQDYFANLVSDTTDKVFAVSAPVTVGGASTVITLTLNSTSGGASAVCYEITGQATWTKTDLQTGVSTATTSVTSATFAPSGSKSFVVQWGRTNSSNRNVTFTNGAEQHSATLFFHEAIGFEVSAGTYVSSFSWTTNSNDNYVVAVAYTTSTASNDRRVIMVS